MPLVSEDKSGESVTAGWHGMSVWERGRTYRPSWESERDQDGIARDLSRYRSDEGDCSFRIGARTPPSSKPRQAGAQ